MATPTKKFTRLYIGDVVASSGSKCFRKLTTQDTAIGTSTFTVKRTDGNYERVFEFEEGMTWEEWCDSEYNTINAHTSAGGTGCNIGGLTYGLCVDSERSIKVVSTDIITNNAIYYTNHSGGSND